MHSLQQIVQAIDISPQRTVLLHGKPFGGEFSNPYVQQASQKMLFQSLENVVYTVFYSKNKQVFNSGVSYPDVQKSQVFVQALSRANSSQERFDTGWTIEQVDLQRQVIAQKGSLKRSVYPGEFLNESGFHQMPVANGAIRLIARREHKDGHTGFYYVFGSTLGEDNYDQFVRIYFNLQAEGAAKLVEVITRQLNEYQVPFQFKCLNDPALYTRCDTAVLYFEKRYSDMVFYMLPHIYAQVKNSLNEETPLFTRRLAKGVAFAESPLKQDESFGTHCSKMIAQGLLQALQKNLGKQAWPDEIAETIRRRHGYTDLETLYRNPGSKYPYSFPQLS